MTTTTVDLFPIIDHETGEILASSESERQELIEIMGRRVIDAQIAVEQGRSARRSLTLLMGVGDAWPDPDRPGFAVMVKPPATPARRVLPAALDEHHEALAPLGMAHRMETVERRVDPKVSDLTSPAAREALARVGLTPEQLVYAPPAGDPQVVVVTPEGA